MTTTKETKETKELVHADYDRSLRASKAAHARIKECWWNARRLLNLAPRRKWMAGMAFYTEGWVADHAIGFFFEHAWVTLYTPDGVVVIDPTLPLLHGEPFEYSYHGAAVYDAADIYRAQLPLYLRANRLSEGDRLAWHTAMNSAIVALGGTAWDGDWSKRIATLKEKRAELAQTPYETEGVIHAES